MFDFQSEAAKWKKDGKGVVVMSFFKHVLLRPKYSMRISVPFRLPLWRGKLNTIHLAPKK